MCINYRASQMQIKATQVKAKDLRPGDLFSLCSQEEWDKMLRLPFLMGHKVHVRTTNPCSLDQTNTTVYRIEIIKK
jgi:hypothetical protein